MKPAQGKDVRRAVKPLMPASKDINAARVRLVRGFEPKRNNNPALKRQRALRKLPFQITGVVNRDCSLDHPFNAQPPYCPLEQCLLTQAPRIKTSDRANYVRHTVPSARLGRRHRRMREHGVNMDYFEPPYVLIQPICQRG